MPHLSALAQDLSAPTVGHRLRLLSYNIQFGIASRHYGQYVTQSWRHVVHHSRRFDNLDHIAQMLSGYDLVGLQEVDAGSLRSGFVNLTHYLAGRAGFPFWYDQTNRRLGRMARHSTGMLSRLRPTDICEHKLPSRIPGRGVMRLGFGHGEDRLAVMIVHLSLGRRARLNQLAYVADLANEQPHVVVMGDLNCHSESPEMDLLIRRTRLCAPPSGQHTFPSWRPARNIDHILVTGDLHIAKAEVLQYPFSDHLPVAMEIELPPSLHLGV